MSVTCFGTFRQFKHEGTCPNCEYALGCREYTNLLGREKTLQKRIMAFEVGTPPEAWSPQKIRAVIG